MNPSLKQFLATPEPPELGPGPRTNVQPLASLNSQLDEAFQKSGLAPARGDLVRAAVLLWHDHFEEAHGIVQDIETQDGSYVHAILHRREPDYGNAKYWFRRVGRHSSFKALAERIPALLETGGDTGLAQKLLPNAQWDAFAFVDACEAAANGNPNTARRAILREIQRAEFEVLLDHLIDSSG